MKCMHNEMDIQFWTDFMFVDYYDYMYLMCLQLLVLLLKYRATYVLLYIFVVFIPDAYMYSLYYLHMSCSIILSFPMKSI